MSTSRRITFPQTHDLMATGTRRGEDTAPYGGRIMFLHTHDFPTHATTPRPPGRGVVGVSRVMLVSHVGYGRTFTFTVMVVGLVSALPFAGFV